jgi:hypothetical protein
MMDETGGGESMEHDAGQGELSSTQSSAVQFASGRESQPGARESATVREIADETLGEEDERPTVEHQAWLKKDDYWQRSTYIAVTGRQTSAAPQTRPLPRPNRFRKSSPLRSITILILTVALIVLIPVGVILAQRAAEKTIKLPTNIPGFSQPTQTLTPAPTHTAKPTATPKKK